MDMRKIKKLIELIQSTGVAEIEIREGEESVRICREIKQAAPVYMPTQTHIVPDAQPEPKSAAKQGNEAPQAANAPSDKHSIKAPMVGTVYLSSTPGAKPFVEIGQTVKVGDVICLIEAMKMFNPIEAEIAGTITAILVENNQPVEFGQPLFTVA